MKKDKEKLMSIGSYNKCYNTDVLKMEKHLNNTVEMYDIIMQTTPPHIVVGMLQTAFGDDDEIPSLLSLLPYYEMCDTDDDEEE